MSFFLSSSMTRRERRTLDYALQNEILKFYGKPSDFALFIDKFDNWVRMTRPSARAKLDMLYKKCQSKAYGAIPPSCLRSRFGYLIARERLEEQFRIAPMLSDAYAATMCARPAIRELDVPALRTLARDIRGYIADLEDIGRAEDIDDPYCQDKLAEKLPYPMYLEWQEIIMAFHRRHRKDPGLQGFLYFVEEYTKRLVTITRRPCSRQDYYQKSQGHRGRVSNASLTPNY